MFRLTGLEELSYKIYSYRLFTMRFTTFIVKYIISIADWTKTIKKIQASATVFI